MSVSMMPSRTRERATEGVRAQRWRGQVHGDGASERGAGHRAEASERFDGRGAVDQHCKFGVRARQRAEVLLRALRDARSIGQVRFGERASVAREARAVRAADAENAETFGVKPQRERPRRGRAKRR